MELVWLGSRMSMIEADERMSKCPACPDAAHDGRACECGCVGSAVLRRLIDEVRNDGVEVAGYNRIYNRYMPGSGPYNRTYNRHNR